jgi:hypothetical protein
MIGLASVQRPVPATIGQVPNKIKDLHRILPGTFSNKINDLRALVANPVP